MYEYTETEIDEQEEAASYSAHTAEMAYLAEVDRVEGGLQVGSQFRFVRNFGGYSAKSIFQITKIVNGSFVATDTTKPGDDIFIFAAGAIGRYVTDLQMVTRRPERQAVAA